MIRWILGDVIAGDLNPGVRRVQRACGSAGAARGSQLGPRLAQGRDRERAHQCRDEHHDENCHAILATSAIRMSTHRLLSFHRWRFRGMTLIT